MEQQDRDLLIRLDLKVDQINQNVADLKSSQDAQWKIIDEHGNRLATHDENLRSINKLLWWLIMLLFGSGGTAGILFYLFQKGGGP